MSYILNHLDMFEVIWRSEAFTLWWFIQLIEYIPIHVWNHWIVVNIEPAFDNTQKF